LNSVKRTKATASTAEKTDKNGNIHMIWGSSGTLVTTFSECQSYLLNSAKTENRQADEAKIEALSSAFTVLAYFEGKY